MKTFTIDYFTFVELLHLVNKAYKDETKATIKDGDDTIQFTIYREENISRRRDEYKVRPIVQVNGEDAAIAYINKVNADLVKAQA